MRKILLLAMAVFVMTMCACSPAFNGRWNGSGEIGEAGFFSFSLQLDRKKPTGTFIRNKSRPVSGVVCNVVEEDGHVEFVLARSGIPSDCASVDEPLTFVGDFGRDVVTGSLLERGSGGDERLVGLFRAFRDRADD